MSQATIPQTRLMTAEEFLRDYGDGGYELVRGQLREMPMPGFRHGYLVSRFAVLLGMFLEVHQLGRLACNDTFVLLERDPDHIRGMDLCYMSFKRMPAECPVGPLEIMPELVVEVKSPSDTWNEPIAKTHDYLTAGVDVVILIDPEKQSLGVYRLNQETISLTSADTLTLPDVLPGFTLELSKLFQ